MNDQANQPQFHENQKTISHVLGEVVWLLSQSPLHKNMFIADLEWMVMTAILLEQFRIFHGSDGRPAGLILWGSVSDETQERLENNEMKLSPQEWKGGDNLWLIEMVSPFGGQDEMLHDAAKSIFAGKSFKYQRTDAEGPKTVIYEPKIN